MQMRIGAFDECLCTELSEFIWKFVRKMGSYLKNFSWILLFVQSESFAR